MGKPPTNGNDSYGLEWLEFNRITYFICVISRWPPVDNLNMIDEFKWHFLSQIIPSNTIPIRTIPGTQLLSHGKSMANHTGPAHSPIFFSNPTKRKSYVVDLVGF